MAAPTDRELVVTRVGALNGGVTEDGVLPGCGHAHFGPGAFPPSLSEAVPATVDKYGGTYLIRGGRFEVAQGDWTPDRVVVIEFGSMDQAKAWYDSPEFEGPKQTLARSSNSNFIFVEGV